MKCENCGIEHNGEYGSGRFCSSVCARGFSTKAKRYEINKKVSISLGGTGIPKEKYCNCLQCGKPNNKNANKFCSHDCERLYYKNKRYKDIEESGVFSSGDSTRFPKAYLIDKHGHKCMICGNIEWMGKPIPLVLDHIDGNSDNWKVDNCRIICQNCNAQTDTFAGRNTGKYITKRSLYRTKYRSRK